MENKTKKIFKRIGTSILSTVVATEVVATTFLVSNCLDKSILDETYATQTRIDYLAEELGVDNSVMNKSGIRRLKHKNGEPINIHFSYNYPEYGKEIAIEILDYIFSLVGEINPLYNYRIVNNIWEADIFYYNGKIQSSTVGIANPIMSTVLLDFEKIYSFSPSEEMTYKYTMGVTVHETLHLFGFKDLYGNSTLYKHSVMDTLKYFNSLSLNEYGSLITTYAPNVGEEELPYLVNDLKQKMNDFSVNECYMIETYLLEKGKTNIKIDNVVELEEDESNLDICYNISINAGGYFIKLLNADKKIIETCVGKVDILTNNFAVLKNVKLQSQLHCNNSKEKCVFDLVIVKLEGGEYVLFPDTRSTYRSSLKVVNLGDSLSL